MNKEHILPQIALRSWPFPRGAGRMIDKFFGHLAFAEPTTTVRTTDGFDITVMPNDLLGRHIYLTGEFDRSIVEVLCNFSMPGDTLLDIGANIGYISSCFLHNVPNSRAVAFEPQPGVGALLRKNLAQFGGRQMVFNVALSDRDGEAHFQIGQHTGTGAIVAGQSNGSIKVQTRASDALLSEIGKVDLVKIDVEGHEETVLQSCSSWLSTSNPRAVIFEEHGSKCAPGGSIHKIFDEAGYDILGIKKTLIRIKLKPIRGASDCDCTDFVAVSRTATLPVSARAEYRIGPRG